MIDDNRFGSPSSLLCTQLRCGWICVFVVRFFPQAELFSNAHKHMASSSSVCVYTQTGGGGGLLPVKTVTWATTAHHLDNNWTRTVDSVHYRSISLVNGWRWWWLWERENKQFTFFVWWLLLDLGGGPPEKHAISIFVIRHHPFRPFLTSIPGQDIMRPLMTSFRLPFSTFWRRKQNKLLHVDLRLLMTPLSCLVLINALIHTCGPSTVIIIIDFRNSSKRNRRKLCGQWISRWPVVCRAVRSWNVVLSP